MTQPLTTDQIEELLQEEIPCVCGRPAQLRSRGHGCPVNPGPFYCCLQCWQKWLSLRLLALQRSGQLKCQDCKQFFPSVEAFSDYRPF